LGRSRGDRRRRVVAKRDRKGVCRRDSGANNAQTSLRRGLVDKNHVTGEKTVNRERLFCRRVEHDESRRQGYANDGLFNQIAKNVTHD